MANNTAKSVTLKDKNTNEFLYPYTSDSLVKRSNSTYETVQEALDALEAGGAATNRAYDSTKNVQGYMVLNPGTSSASVASQLQGKENYIIEIRDIINLNGTTLTIPEGCTLKFVGGKIINGTLVGNETAIDADPVQIFDSASAIETVLAGTWKVDWAYPEWFGAQSFKSIVTGAPTTDGMGRLVYEYTNKVDASVAINKTIQYFDKIKFLSNYYYVSDTIEVHHTCCIDLGGTWSSSIAPTITGTRPMVSPNGAVIWTDEDINVMLVEITEERPSSSYDLYDFKIYGGTLDVSLCKELVEETNPGGSTLERKSKALYTESVLKLKRSPRVLLIPFVDVSIHGPFNFLDLRRNDYDVSDIGGVGIHLTADSGSTGSIYFVKIQGFIGGLGTGVKMDGGASFNSTEFDIKSDYLVYAYDFGAYGAGQAKIHDQIQTRHIYAATSNEHGVIKGNIGNASFTGMVWDLGTTSTITGKSLASPKYVLEPLDDNGDGCTWSDVKRPYFNYALRHQVNNGEATPIMFSRGTFSPERVLNEMNRVTDYVRMIDNDLIGYPVKIVSRNCYVEEGSVPVTDGDDDVYTVTTNAPTVGLCQIKGIDEDSTVEIFIENPFASNFMNLAVLSLVTPYGNGYPGFSKLKIETKDTLSGTYGNAVYYNIPTNEPRYTSSFVNKFDDGGFLFCKFTLYAPVAQVSEVARACNFTLSASRSWNNQLYSQNLLYNPLTVGETANRPNSDKIVLPDGFSYYDTELHKQIYHDTANVKRVVVDTETINAEEEGTFKYYRIQNTFVEGKKFDVFIKTGVGGAYFNAAWVQNNDGSGNRIELKNSSNIYFVTQGSYKHLSVDTTVPSSSSYGYLELGVKHIATNGYNAELCYVESGNWTDAKGYTAALSKGTTAQRPVGLHLNNNNIEGTLTANDIGFEYYDTTLGMPIYAKEIDLSTGSVSWKDSKGFTAGPTNGGSSSRPKGLGATGGILDPDGDIGYEYFDTGLGKPIYATAIAGDGTVTWKDGAGSTIS